MEARMNMAAKSPEGYKGLAAVERYLHACSVEPKLLHLVKLRASQINQCAFCVDMHWKDLRAIGESEQRLYGLSAWEESPYYTQRERAALKWAESVTQLDKGHVPDEVYQEARNVFSENELSDLTLSIAMINTWNRISIASRTVAGNYKSALQPAAK